jgi:hypothetical protein
VSVNSRTFSPVGVSTSANGRLVGVVDAGISRREYAGALALVTSPSPGPFAPSARRARSTFVARATAAAP